MRKHDIISVIIDPTFPVEDDPEGTARRRLWRTRREGIS
jgi:hypothetical protein